MFVLFQPPAVPYYKWWKMMDGSVQQHCHDLLCRHQIQTYLHITVTVPPILRRDVCWLQATSWLSCYFTLSAGLWDIGSYVSMFVWGRFLTLRTSLFLVSEGELLCLLNPSDKTYVKMSVTHTFIDVFILSCHICIFMFGIFSSLKALKLHSTCFLSCCVLIQVQKRKAAFCQAACQFSHQWLAHNFKTQTMANIQAWRGTAH